MLQGITGCYRWALSHVILSPKNRMPCRFHTSRSGLNCQIFFVGCSLSTE